MKKITIILITILLVFTTASAEAVNLKSNSNIDLINLIKRGGEYLLENKIDQMSLKEKVGQLFQVGFSSTEVNEEVKEMIEEYNVGGIIYFSRNLESMEQTAKLSAEIQNLALNSGAEIPLFISTDQEGGIVSRLKGGVNFPGNMALGAADDLELTAEVAEATAIQLKNTGINVNLAPVLDVNNNSDNPVIGVRSFGEDPKKVAEHGTVYIKALQSQNITATAKHFPGHGDTDTDSHLDLPVIKHSRSRLEAVELYPFKKAVEAGVDSIMTAHVYFPAVEKEEGIPATLSKSVLTDLLRDELDFAGLIITDCMEMKAIADGVGTAEGAVRTIEAGSDTVLVSHSIEKQKKAIEKVIKAVEKGRISEKRIDQSVKRILKLKAKRINIEDIDSFNPEKLDYNYLEKLAQKAAEKALSVPINKNLFPYLNIKEKKVVLIEFEAEKISIAEGENKIEYLLADYLAEEIDDFQKIKINSLQKLEKIDPEKLSSKDLIIISSYNARQNLYQAELAQKLSQKNDLAVLAMHNPYDLEVLKDIKAFITTYDYSPAGQKAAADFILGIFKAEGELPVRVL